MDQTMLLFNIYFDLKHIYYELTVTFSPPRGAGERESTARDKDEREIYTHWEIERASEIN